MKLMWVKFELENVGLSKKITLKGSLGKNIFFNNVFAKAERSPLPQNKSKLNSYFYEPLKTSVSVILSTIPDRANGGRARFYMLITFSDSDLFLFH